MKNKHYELKKKYFELLANDPDYPAWQDFECRLDSTSEWKRFSGHISWNELLGYRYNPLPKKWGPKKGVDCLIVLVSQSITEDDKEKLQSYATKLGWLRENGGYYFSKGKENYMHTETTTRTFCTDHNIDDVIFMNKEQAEEWLEMINNGEV